MNIETLEKELNNKKLEPIYVFYGEEIFMLETFVNKIKKVFGEKTDGINYILIDEKNVQSLISEMSTPAFGYEKKLIIVKNSGLLKKEAKKKKSDIFEIQEKLSEYINENLDDIKASVILVIIEEKLDKTPLLQVINKYGVVCEFQKLKPIEIVKRLKNIAYLYKVNITDKTANKLIETAGTSMQVLINEIRKLIEYVGENGTITEEDIDKLVIKQIDSVVFDLTDFLADRKIDKSLEILHNLIYLKEPLQMILIILYRHFKKIYMVKLAENNRIDAMSALDLKPNQMFLLGKYKKQSSYFTEQELRNFLKQLSDLDERSKSGNIDLEIGMEVCLCNLTK